LRPATRVEDGAVCASACFLLFAAGEPRTAHPNSFIDVHKAADNDDRETYKSREAMTCYKLFRREVIQSITIEENRFGFEPEVVAKVAQMRVRVYEMGISYRGRTYAEGKKIGVRDGWRALYCILKYNLPKVPVPIKFLIYIFVGGFSALVNLLVFLAAHGAGVSVSVAALSAFFIAALVNYLLSIKLIFRHNAKWRTPPNSWCIFLWCL
jgi:hypothetical protein